MKTYRDDCGCRHDGARWLELCTGHRIETDALHNQAAVDHAALRIVDTARAACAIVPETDWLEVQP